MCDQEKWIELINFFQSSEGTVGLSVPQYQGVNIDKLSRNLFLNLLTFFHMFVFVHMSDFLMSYFSVHIHSLTFLFMLAPKDFTQGLIAGPLARISYSRHSQDI